MGKIKIINHNLKVVQNKVLQNDSEISIEKVQEIARKVGELVALYHLLPTKNLSR